MVIYQLAIFPDSLFYLSLGVDEFAFAFSLPIFKPTYIIITNKIEYSSITIQFMILELAFLYFGVTKYDAPNTLQYICSSSKLAYKKMINLFMSFELQLLVEEINCLVGVPNYFFYW